MLLYLYLFMKQCKRSELGLSATLMRKKTTKFLSVFKRVKRHSHIYLLFRWTNVMFVLIFCCLSTTPFSRIICINFPILVVVMYSVGEKISHEHMMNTKKNMLKLEKVELSFVFSDGIDVFSRPQLCTWKKINLVHYN